MPSLNKQLANLENNGIWNYYCKMISNQTEPRSFMSLRRICDFGPSVSFAMYIAVSLLVLSCLAFFATLWGNTEQHIVPGMYNVFPSCWEIHFIHFTKYVQKVIHAWLKWNEKIVSMIWFVVIMATLWQKLLYFTFVSLCISDMFIMNWCNRVCYISGTVFMFKYNCVYIRSGV